MKLFYFLPLLLLSCCLYAQTIPREELIFLTAEWKGERFPDGRPKIPDAVVEQARTVSLDDVWTILEGEGYHCQFDGGWKMIHDDKPIVGRAITAMFIPSRPDVELHMKERGQQRGFKGNSNSWPIQQLSKGDVYVADGFGKIADGTLIGSTLGNAIYARSGNGVVFNAAARDLEGLKEINGFNALVRDWDPSFLKNVMLSGLNVPIRIGRAVVLPGDLVLTSSEGVVFVPAHLAEKVIGIAAFIQVKDQFGFEMVKAGKYTPGEIDNNWTDAIREAFLEWQHKQAGKKPMTRQELDKMLEKRTW
ncbi:RraA family protein [Chitinophaga filiformis]|uniref:RraA family protein n=1 Tax=Chitinophaga filiformis TaxID=104663 RepID=UPI001F3A45F6|nr:RraA family protein [Chitinophaga filiformis]MCF6402666.1 RraA family protein [Chitinophaga filiformis]MCF6403416.1 RraA family protein [Chitinophaga filiformis]